MSTARKNTENGNKTLSIGGATYDLFVRLPGDMTHVQKKEHTLELPMGAKVRVEEVRETCGGGACNTSVGLARLGCDASFEGVIGSDQWGNKLLENFQTENVCTDCITIVEKETTSFSIILSDSGRERVILYQSGTNAHMHDMLFDKEILPSMSWIYLNHIQEGSCVIQDDLSEILAQHGEVRLTWNPGGSQIEQGITDTQNALLLRQTNLLMMNKEEALRFAEASSVEDAIRKLLGTGVGIVCVTDGKNGAKAGDGTSLYHCPVIADAVIVDTTGAGDAFGTGMTWALLQGMTLPESLKTGTINATSVVGSFGSQAGLLTDIEMRQRLKTLVLNVEVSPLQ